MNQREISAAFDRGATHYDEHATQQQLVLDALVDKLAPMMPKAARLLDIGCGTGYLADNLRDKQLPWDVFGLDVSPQMCVRAQSRMRVVNASACALPIASQSVDSAFSSLCVQWVDDIAPVFAECWRVLKPGGVLAFSSYLDGTLDELRRSFTSVDAYQHVRSFRTMKAYQAAIEQAGFEVITLESVALKQSYRDMHGLLRYLKRIGASTRHGDIRRGLMTPRQLRQVEKYYAAHFARDDMLQSSWNVGYMLARKA